MSPNDSRPILAVTADLLFAARIRAAAAQGKTAVRLARQGEDLPLLTRTLRPRLVILDLDARWLDAPTFISVLKADAATATIPIVAYVAHVREGAIAAARAAGAERVLARSAFVRLLPELMRG